MITHKKGVLTFTGKDEALVKKYAKEHKLMFRDVVYSAIMNGLAAGCFDKKVTNAKSKKAVESSPLPRRCRA